MPTPAHQRRILHLVGSPENDFFEQLSVAYARDAIEATADPSQYDFVIAYVSPEGYWQFPNTLTTEDIATANQLTFAEAIRLIDGLSIDAVVPQMFCSRGMTSYRILFDLLGVPVIGNPGSVMALAADKAITKSIVASADVATPAYQLFRSNDSIESLSLPFPVVVKPTQADNSVGVSLVSDRDQFSAAVNVAFTHGDQILVEQYIELGREVRCGILEADGDLVGLPLQEYRVDARVNPIRGYESKLCRATDGTIDLTSKHNPQSWMVDRSDPITDCVWRAAKAAHVALGCRDYSLFDFRIDPAGKPWFLEAGLYCSFSPNSIIVAMAEAAGISLRDLFRSLVERNVRNEPTASLLATL